MSHRFFVLVGTQPKSPWMVQLVSRSDSYLCLPSSLHARAWANAYVWDEQASGVHVRQVYPDELLRTLLCRIESRGQYRVKGRRA